MKCLIEIVLIFAVIYGAKADCGLQKVKFRPYITNGYPSEPGDYPWHVAIYHKTGIDISYKCGGTLIEQVILTAAHCVYEGTKRLPRSRVLVHLGRYNLYEIDRYTVSKRVDEIIVHEEFDIFTLTSDIAILKLTTEVAYNNYIQPACIWNEERPMTGERGLVIGWGLTENHELSDVLTQATMPVVDNKVCIEKYPHYDQLISDYTYCAGDLNGTSVCPGDSGGGIFLKVGKRWKIFGIVSFGGKKRDGNKDICDSNVFVVFTNVFKYLNWIQEIAEVQPEGIDVKEDNDTLVNKTILVNPPNCGLNVPKGENITNVNFPWVARICCTTKKNNAESTWCCVGTLINSRYLVTDMWYYQHFAHPEVLKKENAKIVRWFAKLGGFKQENLESCHKNLLTCPFIEEIDIESIKIHPEFDLDLFDNDISLFRMEKEADISDLEKVNPICLPLNDLLNEGRPKSYLATSWDQIRGTGNPTVWSKWELELPIMEVGIKDCGNYYGQEYDMFSKKFCGSKVNCTLLNVGQPLQGRQVHKGVERFVLYGLRIRGTSRCQDPDIYVDVPKYLDWILKKIQP